MRDIYVVPEWAPTSYDFDGLMKEFDVKEDLKIHLNGEFETAGTREHNDENVIADNPGFRAGNWQFVTETGAKLKWNPDVIPDDRVGDEPIWLILSTEARFDEKLNRHTPEDVWNLLPRGQMVNGIQFDLSFDKAAPRWKAAGKKLRVGAVRLSGHEAAIEHPRVTNYGTLKGENFLFMISGGIGMYDRNLIAQLDPSNYVLDDGVPDEHCAHIIDAITDGYNETSDNQVTVNLIAGDFGERAPGEFVHHLRKYAYERDCLTTATGENQVQAHTIYGCMRGTIAGNHTDGVNVLSYGDFFQTFCLETIDNVAKDARYLVQYRLSPSSDGTDAWRQFRRAGDVIARNRSATGIISLDTMGTPTDVRYIRDVLVENNTAPSFEEINVQNLVRRGNSFDVKAGKGCGRFLPSFLR